MFADRPTHSTFRQWRLLLGPLVLLLAGCSSVELPEGAKPVTGFDVARYLGTWHEIARLDHRFERGLSQVTATYSLRDDGSLRVVNRGYDVAKEAWKEAEGRARFLGDPSVGSLKVSFFRPFYGGYHIIALDQEGYEYAMVCGPSHSYLWILAREPDLSGDILARLLRQAHEASFNTNALIFP
jgi:apolipoprotein D and lipocalin family protein